MDTVLEPLQAFWNLRFDNSATSWVILFTFRTVIFSIWLLAIVRCINYGRTAMIGPAILIAIYFFLATVNSGWDRFESIETLSIKT